MQPTDLKSSSSHITVPHANSTTSRALCRFLIPMGTFIVLPTYNEADNLARLVGGLFSLSVPLSVIVVDDNSPDGTGTVADDLASAHPGRLVVIHRSGKLGLGTAYIAGFHRALQVGATSILTMDA